MGEEGIQLARQAYDAFNRGDVDGALQHLDPAIEWRMSDQFTRMERVFRGHEGVREVFEMFTSALDELHVDVRSMHESGPTVIAEVTIGGVLRGTKEPASYPLVQAWTVRDRKAVRLDTYPTLDEAWESIRAMPPASSSDPISDSGTGRLNR
jgi:ketosteroid isomerase-like protein